MGLLVGTVQPRLLWRNPLIARKLLLSPETVKHHLKGIYSKLQVSTREGAVDEARHRGLIP